MKNENQQISRAEFEKNLTLKRNSPVFNNDIKPLLSSDQIDSYQFEEAYEDLFNLFLPKLSGDSWKELDPEAK